MPEKIQDIVRPDPDQLASEWVGQPGLMLRYCELEADARHEHDQAKAYLDLVEAELLLEIRDDPEPFGLPARPNKEVVEAGVTVHKRYRRALRKFLDAKHALDVMSAAVRAVEQRKKSLEKLVELKLMHYYADPKPPRDVQGAREFADDSSKLEARRGIPAKKVRGK